MTLFGRSNHRLLMATALAVSLVGCAHQSLLPRAEEIELPPEFAWQAELAVGPSEFQMRSEAMCSSLGGAEHRRLQEDLLAGSLDLAASIARFEAAQARAREAGASLLPRVDAQLQVTRAPGGAFGAAAGIGAGAGSGSAVTTYQPALAATWELDLWGRLRNRKQAVALDASAARRDVHDIGLSLSATAADLWFGIRAEEALLEVLGEQQETLQRFQELVELRFGQGFGGAQDIGRQRELVLGLEGQVTSTRGRERELQAQLAALLGRFTVVEPEAGDESRLLLPAETVMPELDSPLTAITRRPDVQAAALRLAAEDRRLAAAVKEWLPGMTVSGTLFDFQRSLSQLFEDLLWQVVGSVSQSVYQGGARAARIDQARAGAEEALANYEAALVGAVADVQIAIANLAAQRDLLANLEARRSEASRVLDLSRSAYREGATDYLNVITALQSTQSLEQQLVQVQRQQLSNRVSLCRALGLPVGVPPAALELARPVTETDSPPFAATERTSP